MKTTEADSFRRLFEILRWAVYYKNMTRPPFLVVRAWYASD